MSFHPARRAILMKDKRKIHFRFRWPAYHGEGWIVSRFDGSVGLPKSASETIACPVPLRLSDFASQDDTSRNGFIEALGKAFVEHGYVLLAGGPPREEIQSYYEAAAGVLRGMPEETLRKFEFVILRPIHACGRRDLE